METKTHTTPTWPCVVCGIDSSAVPETYPAAMLLQASGASVLDFLVNFSLLESDGAPSSAWSPVVDNRFICRPCLDVVVSCDQWNTTLHDGLCLLRRKIAGRGSVAAEPRLSVAPGHVDVPIKEEPSVVRKNDSSNQTFYLVHVKPRSSLLHVRIFADQLVPNCVFYVFRSCIIDMKTEDFLRPLIL